MKDNLCDRIPLMHFPDEIVGDKVSFTVSKLSVYFPQNIRYFLLNYTVLFSSNVNTYKRSADVSLLFLKTHYLRQIFIGSIQLVQTPTTPTRRNV